jgi:hypothetical protein
MSAVEGKQIAKGQKVTALVPRVEKGDEMVRVGRQRYADPCNLLSAQVISDSAGLTSFIFTGSIDFSPGLGYPNETFPAHPRND